MTATLIAQLAAAFACGYVLRDLYKRNVAPVRGRPEAPQRGTWE